MFNQNQHLKNISTELENVECLICKLILKKYSALGSHLKYKHNISSNEYYDKFILIEDVSCSCGNKRKFNSIKHGYMFSCGLDCKNKSKGKNNPMFGKRFKRPEHSEFMKGNLNALGNHSRRGMKYNITDEHRLKIIQNIKNLNEKGFENKGGRCQFYKLENLILQGRYELYFAMTSILDLKKPKQIKTPFGNYTPDFETEDCFIEIKSTYTFKICIKGNQYNKIKWVRNNVKYVKFIILDEIKVYNYLKQFNINKLKINKNGKRSKTY